MQVILVCGVNTGVGKTLVSGHILSQLVKTKKVAAYKPVQTGASGYSPDLAAHRSYIEAQAPESSWENFVGDSHMCGYILPLPASPHLAAEQAQVHLDFFKLVDDFHVHLNRRYAFNPQHKPFSTEYHKLDVLLVELAGGVASPITHQFTNLDLIRVYRAYCLANGIDFKLVFVTGGNLGSLSLTLGALETLPQVDYVYWNTYLEQDSSLVDKEVALVNQQGQAGVLSATAVAQKIAADNFAYLQKRQVLLQHALKSNAQLAQQVADVSTGYLSQLDAKWLDKANFNLSEFKRTNPLFNQVPTQNYSLATAKLLKFHNVGEVEGAEGWQQD